MNLRSILLTILFVFNILSACKQEEDSEFLCSFISYYDISTVGRYTHEYHPFLFEKSSYSLDKMEQQIEEEGLRVVGRIGLAGYEAGAVPSHFTNYRECTGSKINDEVQVRSSGGWTQQLHNKFGVMTGYLFRNVSVINGIHEKRGDDALFDHINLHMMPIYKPESYIFQRHAFDRMLPTMQNMQKVLEQHMLERNQKEIFSDLVTFWRSLYENELRFGNKKVLGTQDVLFSIAHAEHLYRSDVPLLKYYVGPDITYPIKVTKMQKQAATYNAQTFVKKFVKHLKPMEGKATVYVFCSFVDGVGKSTLLGNVQNYKKYGANFVDYDPVDNSSSQLAQMYKYDENVFIADLPAQMSHFTYKPDGMVYFDVLAAQQDEEMLCDLCDFVFDHKEELVKKYSQLVSDVDQTLKDHGAFHASLCDPSLPERAFVKNVLLLAKKHKNKWIPFEHDGDHYLFNSSNPHNIRQLFKLEIADSIGLKNYEAEQMLFLDGVRFPLPYEHFVSDLIEKFKDRNIENVVFVDFLSMYPRSSRENIRINYLLQQISLLYDDFSPEDSFYGDFTSDSHLLYKLNGDQSNKVLHSFRKESFVRLCLYNMMNNSDLRTVEGTPIETVTRLLQGHLDDLSEESIREISTLTAQKIKEEKKLLLRVHGQTKNYINVQSLDFDQVIDLGEKIQEIFSKFVKNDRLKKLWKEPGKILGRFDEFEGEVNQKIKLSDCSFAQLLFVISPHNRDETILAPIMRTIRASWYTAFANLVGGKSSSGGKIISIDQEKLFIPPVWVKKTDCGKIAVFRRPFAAYEKEITNEQREIVDFLNISRPVDLRWGVFEKEAYFLSLDQGQTNLKFFAFGSNPTNFKEEWPGLDLMISSFVYDEQHKMAGVSDDVISPDKICRELHGGSWWRSLLRDTVTQAKQNGKGVDKNKGGQKNGASKDNGKKEDEVKISQRLRSKKGSVVVGSIDQKRACRLAVRGLATLESVMKDPYGDISVKNGDKKDFVAALKLFEKVVLPTYFDIIFEKDLFDNYHSVKEL